MRGHAASSARFAYLFSFAGALFFFTSLAYFFWSYLSRFGVMAAGSADVAAVAWNVALFTLFAVHHSVFARSAVRRWMANLVPAALERSVYVWIASALFIAVCAWWRPIGGTAWRAEGVALWAFRCVQAAGVWLTLRSAAVLDVRELAGVRRPAIRTPEDLRPPNEGQSTIAGGLQASGMTTEYKTTGPYGWVRHPIYTGWFLFVWGASPMTMTRLTFAAISCLYLLVAIPLEERTMRADSRSGGAYERYMTRVRWRLVPGVY